MKRLAWAYLLAASAFVPACSPWNYGTGDFYAGTVDPAKYPAIYTGGGTKQSSGVFIPVQAATLSAATILTYALDVPANQSAAADETGIPELTLAIEPIDAAGYFPDSPSLVYTFDATATEPYPATSLCTAPTNYVFDARTESYRRDYQGLIFTQIPQTGGDPFVPYMAEVAVTSKSLKCQGIKDDEGILKNKDVTVPIVPADPLQPGTVDEPKPSGKLVALYPVDPRAQVEPSDTSGWGSQKWGWYKHYLFAYIDGGYIPTQQVSVDIGEDEPLTFAAMRPQKWFFPATRPASVEDPDTGDISFPKDPDTMEYEFIDAGGPGLSNNAAEFAGAITDVVEAARGEAGYSPICELCTFEGTTADWDAFLVDGNPLPLFSNTATATCTGTYVYCPQQAK